MADSRPTALPAGLSTFGLLLTGRLSLRNELLSAISVNTKTPFASRETKREHEVWDERYFVLTRKALHYYVRAGGRQQLGSGRDMFGKHEGSIAITSILSISEELGTLELTLVTKGPGRNYVLRARNQVRWPVRRLRASATRPCPRSIFWASPGAGFHLEAAVRLTLSWYHHVPSFLSQRLHPLCCPRSPPPSSRTRTIVGSQLSTRPA